MQNIFSTFSVANHSISCVHPSSPSFSVSSSHISIFTYLCNPSSREVVSSQLGRGAKMCGGPQNIELPIWEQCSFVWNCCSILNSCCALKMDRTSQHTVYRCRNREEVKADATFRLSVLQSRQLKSSFNAALQELWAALFSHYIMRVGFTNSQVWQHSGSLHALYNTVYVLLLSSLCVTQWNWLQSREHSSFVQNPFLFYKSWHYVCVCILVVLSFYWYYGISVTALHSHLSFPSS